MTTPVLRCLVTVWTCMVFWVGASVAGEVRVLHDAGEQVIEQNIRYFVERESDVSLDALIEGEVTPDWQSSNSSPLREHSRSQSAALLARPSPPTIWT